MLTNSGENEIKSVVDFVPCAAASIVEQYSLLLFICLFVSLGFHLQLFECLLVENCVDQPICSIPDSY